MVFMSPRGGPSRCYNFWMDFAKCVQDEMQAGKGFTKACKPYAEDYQECLHHRKYHERQLAIEQEEQRQQYEAAHGPKHH